MDRKPYTVTIARGDGLVARFGDVVLYIADANACAERLLAVSESASDTEHPGAVIPARLATVVFGRGDSHRITPFGVVTTSAEGLHVILRGPVTAHIDDANGTQTLCGSRALTWVDEILPASVHAISVAGSFGSRVSGCPRTDLRGGVVPGSGFVIHRVADVETVVRTDHVAPQRRWPMAGPTEPFAPSRTPVATSAIGAVGAALASQDGAVYPLDRSYVIGRYPLGDDAVRNAAATPIVLHNDHHVSRVHAYVSIDRGTVYVRDASTASGTFIAAPGAKDWTRIGTTPTQLEPGWSMRVGERILTYHAGG